MISFHSTKADIRELVICCLNAANAVACRYHLPLCAFHIRFKLLLKNLGKCNGIWRAGDINNTVFLFPRALYLSA